MITTHDKTPRYNLKAVVQETGLRADTLRAWERRYGLPEPNRTSGKHRLYSQFDIEIFKWLVARRQEGLSISRAADLWHQLIGSGKDPLTDYVKHTPLVLQSFLPNFPSHKIEDYQQQWFNACMSFDELLGQYVLAQAFAVFPVETVCFEVLCKSLFVIGEKWYTGEITIQQEHFASALATRQIEVLLAATPPPTKNGRLIVACPPHEFHTFSPLLISLLLRRQGWDVVYLGANVPLDRFEAAIATVQPKLVIISAQTLYTAATTLDIAQLLQQLRVPLAFGGSIFNTSENILPYIPGYYLGSTLQMVCHKVEQLLASPPHPLQAQQLTPIYQTALKYFTAQQSLVEMEVHKLLSTSFISKYLKTINLELGQGIISALKLGDISLMKKNVEWVHGVLAYQHEEFDQTAVRGYLQIYHQVAQTLLDERAAPIIAWLSEINQ